VTRLSHRGHSFDTKGRWQVEWHLHMMGRPTGNQGVKQKAEDIPATICVSQGETDIEKCEVF